jgi:nucleotide-binding universal stress UspA family protein
MEEGLLIGVDWVARGREEERRLLAGVVERVRGVSGVPLQATLLDGPVADALCQHASSQGIDLVVLTTHGRGALSRFWLGSTADQLVRRLPMPVIAFRPTDGKVNLTEPVSVKRILVPLDGSPLAEEVLEPAVTLGNLLQSTLQLVQVIDPLQRAGQDSAGFPVSGLNPEALEQVKKKVEAYLKQVADRIQGRVQGVGTRVLIGTQAAAAILDLASTDADLIALATHGYGGLKRLILGSVADKVLRGASVPVLVYHPQGK